MINGIQMYSTGLNTVITGTPVQVSMQLINADFVVLGIVTDYTTQTVATFTLELANSRDQYSRKPILMESYGEQWGNNNYGAPMYTRHNKKPLFFIKGCERVIITFTTLINPDTLGLSLYGYHINAQGSILMNGSNPLPPAVAAKL